MKREEAISLLGWFKSKTNREDDLEAIDMAIKALQGGGGDLISRDDAIRELNGACSTWEDDAKVQEIVMAIPSAEQVAGKLNNPCDSLLKADSDECKEQKSKLDLISRADAMEAVRMSEHRITIADEQGGVGTVKWDMWGVYTAEAVEAIKALPSAEAVQGEWIDMEISCNPYPPVFCVECSMCGYRVGRETFLENTFNFCPSCGAKMTKGGDTE